MSEPDAPPRHLVLVGLMGSGKTTVGRLVAERLGWPMTDSDAWIRAREGTTGREILETRGAEALWAMERRHLREGLATPGPTVICAAASTVDDDGCREAMLDPSLVVAWLTVTPETAAGRFDNEAHRPRFGDDPLGFLARQLEERGPRFREVADLELATDDATPDQLADAIAGWIARPVPPA